MRAEFSALDFEPCLNQEFRIRLDGHDPVAVELVEIRGLSGHTRREDRSPFSLLFRGAAGGASLPQQIYGLEHDGLGELDLFLVPLAPHPDDSEQRPLYEAIFT